MTKSSSRFTRPRLVLGAALLSYFVIYPEDLQTLLAPVHPVLETVEAALNLAHAVSPWFYGLAASAILAWTVNRVWGGRPQS